MFGQSQGMVVVDHSYLVEHWLPAGGGAYVRAVPGYGGGGSFIFGGALASCWRRCICSGSPRVWWWWIIHIWWSTGFLLEAVHMFGQSQGMVVVDHSYLVEHWLPAGGGAYVRAVPGYGGGGSFIFGGAL